MTRPNQSALVLDGETVKLRLQADRADGRGLVHVDWLRFTVVRRDAPIDVELLFPRKGLSVDGNYSEIKADLLERHLKVLEAQEQYAPAAQALTLANEVVEVLGEGFKVGGEVLKGHDFYAKRWPITFNDCEVGWIGFGASSDSPRQRKQADTIHCNLYGTACTFARFGWREIMADKLDEWNANITRCDLALDFFDGFQGGLDQVIEDYKAGAFDYNSQRPKCSGAGDWVNHVSRSFYVGSREAGKQTNIYEKGHQLYGPESGSQWLRWELRYGNKLRVLSSQLLRDPDAFFAGASGAHQAALNALADKPIQPETVETKKRLEAETVEAEVTRNVRWLERVAAPSLAAAWHHLGDEGILSLVTGRTLPRRLQKFAAQVPAAFRAVGERFYSHGASPSPVMA